MSILADKYARILATEVSDNSAESFYEILAWISNLISTNKKLTKLLNTPILEENQKLELIRKLANAAKIKLPPIAVNLLTLLIKSNNLLIINEIAYRYHQFLLKKKGVAETKVTFAHKPTEKQLEEIEALLKAKFNINPIISVEIDESIIAGFIIMFDGKRLNASLEDSFNNLNNLYIE